MKKTTAQLIRENTKSRETLDYPPKDIEEEMARVIAKDYGFPRWEDGIPAARIIWKQQRKNKKLF